MVALWILLGLIGFVLLCILFLWVSTLFIDSKKKYNSDSAFYRWILYTWTAIAVFLCRIRISVKGKEKLPEGRFLLVQNHRSNFDPILTWHVLRKYDLSFISKEENFSVPLFGKIVHRLCFLPIDRENPRNALKTIMEASELISNDVVSIVVYPEGTRNKNSEEVPLLPFHNGVLKIAQRSQVPIVVTTIRETEKIHKNFPWKRSKIELEIVDVIDANTVQAERSDALAARVEQRMLEAI